MIRLPDPERQVWARVPRTTFWFFAGNLPELIIIVGENKWHVGTQSPE